MRVYKLSIQSPTFLKKHFFVYVAFTFIGHIIIPLKLLIFKLVICHIDFLITHLCFFIPFLDGVISLFIAPLSLGTKEDKRGNLDIDFNGLRWEKIGAICGIHYD